MSDRLLACGDRDYSARRSRGARRLALAAGLVALSCGPFLGSALAQSPASLSLLAGNGAGGTAVPGIAANSPLGGTNGIGSDAYGNIYISDTTGHRIDRITPDGTLTVIAGTGSLGAPTPGPALSSALGNMNALAVDPAGNVFVADNTRHQIDKISAAGSLSIVVGNGTDGASVAGPAVSSPFSSTNTLGTDPAGNLYYQDSANGNTLWKVTPDGVQTKIAGNGSPGLPVPGDAFQSPLDGSAFGIGGDSAGNVYMADPGRCIVVKITPAGALSIIAGTGTQAAPVPGPATSSPIGTIYGVAVDPDGNVFIADLTNRLIEKVTPAGTLAVVAGNGSGGIGSFVPGPPTASPIGFITTVSVDSTGALGIITGNRLLRVGSPEPSAPRNITATPGASGSATVSFTPPGNAGTTPVTAYQASTDGGVTWQPVTTTSGSGRTLFASIGDLTPGGSYQVLVRAVNGSGAGDASSLASLSLPAVAPPSVPQIPLLPAAFLAPIPAPTSPFTVVVQFRIPAACTQPCKLKAKLFLRDGTTLLGARSALKVNATGLVRIAIPIDRAVLTSARSIHDAKGYSTTQTRFLVSIQAANGRWRPIVKLGRITVALGRIASGKAPVTNVHVF